MGFLRRDQTAEGPWYGRWGVNYLYGTSGALRALETLGLQKEPEGQRGVAWLRAVQNPDGGYGESCASYDDPELKARGQSTASQTAWALIGLLAAGESSRERREACRELSARATARERNLGGSRLYRHRVPTRFLS